MLVFLPGERGHSRAASTFAPPSTRRLRSAARFFRAPAPGPAATPVPNRTAIAASCWPPMSPKPPSRFQMCVASSIRGWPASAAMADAPACNACPSKPYPRRRRINAWDVAGAPRLGCACACTARKTIWRASEFTEPEIRRTNLAAVLLEMRALGIPRSRFLSVSGCAGSPAGQRRLPVAARARCHRCRRQIDRHGAAPGALARWIRP